MIVAAFVWLLAHIGSIGVLEQFCFVVMVIVCIWGVLGDAVARAMLMSLTILLFAVPFGESLIPKLQDFSAWFAVRAFDLGGIPVLLEGRYISVPSGKWEVAETCSGTRYVTSSLVVGLLFAGIAYKSWVRRGAFFLASAIVPVLANAVRVYGIIFLGHISSNRIAAGVDHFIYGWLFFTVVTLVLLALGARWREKLEEQRDLAVTASDRLRLKYSRARS